MSKYTTGEIAKLCNVSVRTVQYYDNRNILVPSQLSEGGRRLYSQEDLRKMRIICFLREMGFSLDHIAQLFSEEHPDRVVALLIDSQEQQLRSQLRQNQEKLDMLTDMKRSLRRFDSFSLDSLGDIAHIMKNQKKRRQMLIWMVILGVFMDLIEIGTVIYGVQTGIWWPVAVGLPVILGLGIFVSWLYFSHTDYICPECHQVFHPKFGQALWARHTPNTRRLTCPCCGHKGFCVETYREGEKT